MAERSWRRAIGKRFADPSHRKSHSHAIFHPERNDMISRGDLERLLHREDGEHQILSIFLDMSVNSDNKRTHKVFLNQRRSQFEELQSDRANHHHEALGEALAKVD